MNADRDHVNQLASLAFWGGPIAVETLPGGITNANYLVRSGATEYVARLCVDRTVLGIDRRNEVACQRAAHSRGVAPEVLHSETGVLISTYVTGRTLTSSDLRAPALIPRLAALLRALHDGHDERADGVLSFSAIETAFTYARTARKLNAGFPNDIARLHDDARRLDLELSSFVPALCHNDLLATNVIDDGRRLWLVDWEYAGLGRPLFDLASVSANNAYSEAMEVALLTAYRDTLDPRELRELRILKTLSHLREALWATIQTVASEIAFDYQGYAEANFQAYREALRHLSL